MALAVSVAAVADDAPVLLGQTWINVQATQAPTLKDKGHVTLVHFWTFACSNCQANLPIYDRLFAKYASSGLDFVGVHTPELDFEKKTENVRKAIDRFGIKWPVLIDPAGGNWQRWRVRYWPTVFLVDKKGVIRSKWEGELNFRGQKGEEQVEHMIRQLLAEKG